MNEMQSREFGSSTEATSCPEPSCNWFGKHSWKVLHENMSWARHKGNLSAGGGGHENCSKTWGKYNRWEGTCVTLLDFLWMRFSLDMAGCAFQDGQHAQRFKRIQRYQWISRVPKRWKAPRHCVTWWVCHESILIVQCKPFLPCVLPNDTNQASIFTSRLN